MLLLSEGKPLPGRRFLGLPSREAQDAISAIHIQNEKCGGVRGRL